MWPMWLFWRMLLYHSCYYFNFTTFEKQILFTPLHFCQLRSSSVWERFWLQVAGVLHFGWKWNESRTDVGFWMEIKVGLTSEHSLYIHTKRQKNFFFREQTFWCPKPLSTLIQSHWNCVLDNIWYWYVWGRFRTCNQYLINRKLLLVFSTRCHPFFFFLLPCRMFQWGPSQFYEIIRLIYYIRPIYLIT